MKAAVVTRYDAPPRCADYATPTAGPGEFVVDVLAAGLHPRVRSQADGSHYTTTGALPLVPGIDGVGRDADGALRYFLLDESATLGSMAEQTVVDPRRSVALPADTDAVAVAAAMNPAMSSWVALRRRITFPTGGRVLVLGATGNAGSMAVRVAALFGASSIVAAARNADALTTLPALGATDTVLLDGSDDGATRLGAAASEVDVVLDYLWGDPAAAALRAIIPARPDRSRPLDWVQIGSVAGATSPIPSAALRAARLQLVGSGQGSIGAAEYVAELPGLAAAITRGDLRAPARAVALADVEQAWADTHTGGDRVVLVPQSF